MITKKHQMEGTKSSLLLGSLFWIYGCSAVSGQVSKANRPQKVSEISADTQGLKNGVSILGNFSKESVTFKVDLDGTSLDAHGRPVPFDDASALTSLQELCGSCHGPGKSVNASWALPEDSKLNVKTLRTLSRMEVAYQALLKKFLKLNSSSPSAMPPVDLGPEARVKLARTLTWMQDTFPEVVARAESQYPLKAPFQSENKVTIEYKCKSVLRTPEILSRFTETVLGRPPSLEEVQLGAKNSQELKTSGKTDDEVAMAFLGGLATKAFDPQDPWFLEMMSEKGALFKLAQKVSSSGALKTLDLTDITPQGIDPFAARSDLQQEFYRLLKQFATSMPYAQILTKQSVMVSENTSYLYPECAKPKKDWAECKLSDLRSNFFGTRGFLMAKPSSFLTSNNNYGRGGDLYTVLSGSVLMANTNGVSGDEPAPIPACIATTDGRWKLKDPKQPELGKAPWGSLAVPDHGKVCQACHLNRHLAAASHLFRPFGAAGEKISASDLREDSLKDAKVKAGRPSYVNDLKAALADTVVNLKPVHSETERSEFVNVSKMTIDDYVKMLQEVTSLQPICSMNANGDGKTVQLKNLSDLVNLSIGNGSILIEGFTRFFPSTFLNQTTVSGETREVIAEAFNANAGYLLPLMKAYFSSRSFICAEEIVQNEK
jgi:hypothetical protein